LSAALAAGFSAVVLAAGLSVFFKLVFNALLSTLEESSLPALNLTVTFSSILISF
jgi:hypothetical protein